MNKYSKNKLKYLSLCEERVKFRNRLIDVIKRRIVEKEKEKREEIFYELDIEIEKKEEDIILKEENEILKYYYYLIQGIDDVYIGSIDINLLKNILNRVPTKWKEVFKNTLDGLVKEVKDEYLFSIKKAVIEFVIGESPYFSLYEFAAIEKSKFKGVRFSKEHEVQYHWNRAKLERKLVLYHPIIRRIFDFWNREFSDCKLLCEAELASREYITDLEVFERTISKMYHKTKEDLLKYWLPKIQALFITALHRDELPRRSSAKYRKFFNCVAVIMEEQLRGLFLRSIEEFFNYLHNKNVSYIFATRRDWKEKKPGKEIIMKLWHSIIKIRYLSFFLFYIRFIIFCIIIVLLKKKPNLKI